MHGIRKCKDVVHIIIQSNYTLNIEAPVGMVGIVLESEQAARTESSQAVSSWRNDKDDDDGGNKNDNNDDKNDNNGNKDGNVNNLVQCKMFMSYCNSKQLWLTNFKGAWVKDFCLEHCTLKLKKCPLINY